MLFGLLPIVELLVLLVREVAKAVPLGAALGAEGDLVVCGTRSVCHSVFLYFSPLARAHVVWSITHDVVIDHKRILVDHLLLEACPAEERRIEEVKRKTMRSGVGQCVGIPAESFLFLSSWGPSD